LFKKHAPSFKIGHKGTCDMHTQKSFDRKYLQCCFTFFGNIGWYLMYNAFLYNVPKALKINISEY